jgi:hypothetical protein
MVSEIAAELFT